MRLPSLRRLIVGGMISGLLLSWMPFAWSAEPEVESEWTVAPRCYRYGFVSDRRGGADNLFYSDSCTNQTQQLTSNLDPNIHYSNLSMSRSIGRIAYHEADISSNGNGRSTEWLNFVDTDSGSVSLMNTDANYDGKPDFVVTDSAWGPDNQLAYIQSDLEHDDLRFSLNDQWPYLPQDARTLLFPDPTGSRIFGRLDWIPTSRRMILTMALRGEPFRLYVVNADSGEMFPLQETDASDERAFAMAGEDPSVSRSGKLAFIRNGHIETCDLDDSQATSSRPLFFCKNTHPVYSAGRSQSLCWTYDDQKIIFSSSTSETPTTSDLYMMSPTGSELRKLTEYSGKNAEPVCFPFGY